MSRKKTIVQHIVFWGILAAAVTAEGWMNLICGALF